MKRIEKDRKERYELRKKTSEVSACLDELTEVSAQKTREDENRSDFSNGIPIDVLRKPSYGRTPQQPQPEEDVYELLAPTDSTQAVSYNDLPAREIPELDNRSKSRKLFDYVWSKTVDGGKPKNN